MKPIMYCEYLYPLLLVWGKLEKEKKNQPRALFGPDIASHAERAESCLQKNFLSGYHGTKRSF